MIRKATQDDIPAIAAIYERIHDREEAGAGSTGWKRGVYPTEATARAALNAGDLFVDERGGRIAAAARINREQVPEYALARWQCAAPADKIMVLHTLTVDPDAAGQGVGTGFVAFYEQLRPRARLLLPAHGHQRDQRPRPRPLQAPGLPRSRHRPLRLQRRGKIRLVCLEKRLEGEA